MKIHEYQGKQLLAAHGVPVPQGKVAYSVDEAVKAAKELGLPVVVKAQIHAGGRGKAGGVKLARTADEVETIAKAMLGSTLHTHQTGPEGRVVLSPGSRRPLPPVITRWLRSCCRDVSSALRNGSLL